MYRIPENAQMALEDFELPFGGKLDAENRWVEMSLYVPWELVEEIYASKFKNDRPDEVLQKASSQANSTSLYAVDLKIIRG